jgi:protein-tyrosine kinase
MARVLDALRRDQQRKKTHGRHDPLAEATGTPATVEQADETNSFELPARIGAPNGPRSNEGLLLPGAPLTQAETQPAPNTSSLLASENGRATSLPVIAPEMALTNGYHSSQLHEPPRVAQAQIKADEVHARLLMLREPHAAGCEQYRMLRTQLFHAAERERTKVVVVTSALAGEGKTATLLNLALAIAQSPNRRVLVIDGDLRRPRVAPYLGLKPFSGFTEVLQNKVELFDAMSRLDEHELYLLPVKRETTTPAELLSGPRFQAVLHELRRYFDFILLDSPPVRPFADARLLTNHADAVLFVVRAGFAPYETVEQAVESLEGQRILGVVLNGATDVREVSEYQAYLNGYERGESTSLAWSVLAPCVRDSWLGRRLKL